MHFTVIKGIGCNIVLGFMNVEIVTKFEAINVRGTHRAIYMSTHNHSSKC